MTAPTISDITSDTNAVSVKSSAYLASFRGAMCRCGCGGPAVRVMTGTEFGRPIAPEPCCNQAALYCAAFAAESGDEFGVYDLEVNAAGDRQSPRQ